MPSKFASGKNAIAQCDRCGFRFKLRDLRSLTIKTKQVSIKVCRDCWEPDHPQLQLGLYPVNDPQAVRDPRPDTSLAASRALVFQVTIGAGVGSVFGFVTLGVASPEVFALESGGENFIFLEGGDPVPNSEERALLQEDDDLVLQEDGFTLLITPFDPPPILLE
jgi:hypothetical protein